MKPDKEHKLLRIKISIEYEVVGDDIYVTDDIQKAGEGIFRANRNDIISEAIESGLNITVSEIKTKEDLPPGYTLRTLPWLNVSFVNKDSDVPIGKILEKD
jgi:hypothetical protein